MMRSGTTISPQIIYLSHADGRGHGRPLAEDFAHLLTRWLPLGCPGGEDWQWFLFTDGKGGYLNPDGADGRIWRRLIGLDS